VHGSNLQNALSITRTQLIQGSQAGRAARVEALGELRLKYERLDSASGGNDARLGHQVEDYEYSISTMYTVMFATPCPAGRDGEAFSGDSVDVETSCQGNVMGSTFRNVYFNNRHCSKRQVRR
jgi:hypothetical protein